MDKKKIIFIGISVLVCILVYVPTPKKIDPQEYNPAQPVSLDDLEIPKNKLDKAVYINTPFSGAEDVEFDKDGNIYSGLHDGSVIRIDRDSLEVKVVGKTQGAIFGIDINANGDKLALADQVSGIKILNLKTGVMESVVSEYEGAKFASPNAVVFGQNDQVLYFTVSSQSIPMSEFHQMLLYSQGSGRIFTYNVNTKSIQLLADHLYFANGLEYNAKDNCLYFIETGRSRLSRLELKPQKRGNITVITNNILGYPDNVKQTESGQLWVAIPALRDSFSNIIDHNSLIRRVILNLRVPLSMFLAIANMKYAGGVKINPKTGQIVDYFFGNSDNINCISGINQNGGRLYLSSLGQNKIAVVSLNNEKIQLSQPKQQPRVVIQPIIQQPPKQTPAVVPQPKQQPQKQQTTQQQQQYPAKQQAKQQAIKQQTKQQIVQSTATTINTPTPTQNKIQATVQVAKQQIKEQVREQIKQEVKVVENKQSQVPAANGKAKDNVNVNSKDVNEQQDIQKEEVKPANQNSKSTAGGQKPKKTVKTQATTTTTTTTNQQKAQPQGQTTTTKPKAGQQQQQQPRQGQNQQQKPQPTTSGRATQANQGKPTSGAHAHGHSHGHTHGQTHGGHQTKGRTSRASEQL